eukprot:TRINITY_DN5034_c0_g1_i1.p2 TRINITY_DN5034_c0_g1~~TRINITY_DN5034_c0_g1_i1.p2  ORF type:complete len:132 (+),score=49.41 TRINITY_DN5034_c0_g1_i1:57-452(+)
MCIRDRLYRDKIGPALRVFVPEEMKRFDRFAEKIASKGSQSIVAYHSPMPKHSIQKLVVMDMKSKSAQLTTLKNVMANQRKIYFALLTIGAVLFMILVVQVIAYYKNRQLCLLYTSPSPRDLSTSRMPSSA